jgi:hypothetical protein
MDYDEDFWTATKTTLKVVGAGAFEHRRASVKSETQAGAIMYCVDWVRDVGPTPQHLGFTIITPTGSGPFYIR